MLIINNISYSNKNLITEANIKILDTTLEEWEKYFWNFLFNWHNKESTEIIVKTSGSTGVPKSISHKKEFMRNSARATCTFFNLNEQTNALLCLPASSIGGIMMIVRALEVNMKLTIIKPNSNPLKDINSRIDFVAMVPFQVQKSILESNNKWKFIKTVIIGGGKISVSLKQELIKNQISAYSTFGMTETISHVAINKIGHNDIFKSMPNCYFSRNKDNCLVVDAEHIGVKNLITNDIVELLDSNRFIWKGRKDNAIEIGGLKILPETIEQKIAHLFKENRFFIYSIPDKLLNNKLVLVIESNKLLKFNIESLFPYLLKYEYPKEVFFIEKFIETRTGKILRKKTFKIF